jgi:hypothetical protein
VFHGAVWPQVNPNFYPLPAHPLLLPS